MTSRDWLDIGAVVFFILLTLLGVGMVVRGIPVGQTIEAPK